MNKKMNQEKFNIKPITNPNIKEHSYHTKLYGKIWRNFDFQTLQELNELKQLFPADTAYKLSDCCTSLPRTMESIKKELQNSTMKDLAGKDWTRYEYAKQHGQIVKLTSPYIFRCECLRGYQNTIIIEWISGDYQIKAETKKNLWPNVTETTETDTNTYAENTVKPVKLIPLHPQKLRTYTHAFHYINWSGGNITTININESDEYVKEFETAIFENKSAFAQRFNTKLSDFTGYTPKQILELPTIETGHTENLKIHVPLKTKIWVSRLTTDDGMPYNNQIVVEQLKDSKWTTVLEINPTETQQ